MRIITTTKTKAKEGKHKQKTVRDRTMELMGEYKSYVLQYIILPKAITCDPEVKPYSFIAMQALGPVTLKASNKHKVGFFQTAG